MLKKFTVPSMPLASGAVWRGSQTSGSAAYDVEVRICTVDEQGDLAGTLTIRNLTKALPKVVTYFDAEIIGTTHSLLTAKWGATEEDDKRHWGRFKRDLNLSGANDLDDASLRDAANVVFMRLKERCIIDAADKDGASCTGFYYIAIDINPSPTLEIKKIIPPKLSSTPSLLSERRSLASPPLIRTGSYASIVSGRNVSPSPARNIPYPSFPYTANGVKSEDTDVTVASVTSSQSSLPFSPPIEEYPLPNSPTSSAASSRSTSLQRNSRDAHGPVSSPFYNSTTGYRGAWAQAIMKGFYFGSESDAYQQLELHYVGDGLGAPLEEYGEPIGGFDEWGNERSIDEAETLERELVRRRRLSQPPGSASFTIL